VESTVTCPSCGVARPPDDFYASRRDCRPCVRAAVRRYQRDNAEAISATRAAARRTPEGKRKQADRSFRRYYGIGIDDVLILLAMQGGGCAICRTPLSVPAKGTHVDHDHETGAVRGILCATCNLMIGHSQEDPLRLRLAAEYLERPRLSWNG
jgi:hypothetical protein